MKRRISTNSNPNRRTGKGGPKPPSRSEREELKKNMPAPDRVVRRKLTDPDGKVHLVDVPVYETPFAEPEEGTPVYPNTRAYPNTRPRH